jgi:protein SCO1/2
VIRLLPTLALLTGITLAPGIALAQGAGMPAPRILETKDEAASMLDRIGAKVDPDLEFLDERGYPFKLRQMFPGEQPVVLLLGYYTCPAMCGQVLGRESRLAPGKSRQNVNERSRSPLTI